MKATRWLVVLVPGVLLYTLPLPGLNVAQRHLLAIFTATVIALVAQPVAMGVSTTLALTILALTKTVAPNQVFAGYSNQTVWLIFTAFVFAGAVTSSQFGLRVAYLFISRFGTSPLTLSYSIAATNLVLAPFIPSDTARGGGIISPVVANIARAARSIPATPSSGFGGFLTLAGFHSTYTTSAMFLTGMAANPLIADFARQGAHVNLTWIRWAIGAIVPGLVALAALPWFIQRMHPPHTTDTALARAVARVELDKMGPLTRRETRLVAILVLVMAGWVTTPWHGMSSTIVALTGVTALLITGVISWDEFLAEHRAWEAMIWFGALIMMADNLLQTGVVDVLSKGAFRYVQGWPGMVALAALVTLYMYVHYGFASMTAQVTALYPAFLAATLVGGVNPLVASLSLGYFSNLNAAMTHYGTGSAPVFFGNGYVTQRAWWKVGLLASLINLAIWLGLGLVWWKLLGWW